MNKTIGGLAAGLLAFVAVTAWAQTAAPNDAQIAAIVVAANTVDIDAGKLAKSRAQNKEVKDFAVRMIADHGASNDQASALAKKLKLTPEENATSKKLKDDGAAMRKKLNGMKGGDFDKAYVDNEVSYHQAVLDTIDKTLIPNAKNAELKDLLTKTRPVIEDHLQHAKRMQTPAK